MIEVLEQIPENVAGFRATGNITKEDFEQTVMPEVAKRVQQTGKLNYLLVLDTSLKDFSLGAWLQDALLGIQNLLRWNRAAIVTDIEGIHAFTKVFSALMPGEFRGFSKIDMDVAVEWVSEKSDRTESKIQFNG